MQLLWHMRIPPCIPGTADSLKGDNPGTIITFNKHQVSKQDIKQKKKFCFLFILKDTCNKFTMNFQGPKKELSE